MLLLLRITVRVPWPLLAKDIRKIFQFFMEFYRIFKLGIQQKRYTLSIRLVLWCSCATFRAEDNAHDDSFTSTNCLAVISIRSQFCLLYFK